MKILICGGGIGGLTTALCGLHHGHEVTVFEQAHVLGETGAGIQIPPNAMKVFAALGIADDIARNAFRPESIEARMGESGLGLFTIPLAEHAVRAWGAPYYHIHRADYIEALKNALLKRAPGTLQLASTVSGYQQDETSVSVLLENGQRVCGDVLIGADGIHSSIRAQMLGPDQPQFTGQTAWRAVVPIEKLGSDLPNPTACVWMGRGRHGVTYRLRRGTLANFVGVVERDDWTANSSNINSSSTNTGNTNSKNLHSGNLLSGNKESWSQPGSRREALADFAGWHPVITRIISESDQLYRWALFDRAPLNSWLHGRVALLGDAAHPMLPFLAQGAAMAVEDAWTLARELAHPGRHVSQLLYAYQQQRIGRTSAVQAGSRVNASRFHQRSVAGRLMTYGPMWLAGKIAPSLIHRRTDWLYGYDVTA